MGLYTGLGTNASDIPSYHERFRSTMRGESALSGFKDNLHLEVMAVRRDHEKLIDLRVKYETQAQLARDAGRTRHVKLYYQAWSIVNDYLKDIIKGEVNADYKM
jgi:hypothetical protein